MIEKHGTIWYRSEYEVPYFVEEHHTAPLCIPLSTTGKQIMWHPTTL